MKKKKKKLYIYYMRGEACQKFRETGGPKRFASGLRPSAHKRTGIFFRGNVFLFFLVWFRLCEMTVGHLSIGPRISKLVAFVLERNIRLCSMRSSGLGFDALGLPSPLAGWAS